MKKNFTHTLKAGTAVTFALSLVVSSPLQSLAVQAAAPTDTEESVTAAVYPKPQSMEYTSTEGMKFDGTVNLVVRGGQDDQTLPKLKAVLEDAGISYAEGSEASADQATILVTTDAADYASLGHGGDAALSEEQGYVLEATNDENAKGQVTILGADEDGAYYGVLTLEQMLEQKTADGSFAEAVISDYPNIKLRGFVEGFYGFPWSFEERLGLIKDTAEFKMNTYIYAPKDDPYHKDQWRTPYPDDKAEEIRQLAAESEKDNVSFCWSAHPGYGFNYNTDDDYNALIAKFEQLYSLGVRQFGISYDDLSGYVSGTNHANIINRVNREFVQEKGDVKPLIVVATRYCNSWGSSMTTYFKPFMETLDEDVVVMWTGSDTMSAITKESYEWPKTQTGVDRDLASWWNYPVNDYCEGNLMMAPLEILHTDVDNLSGFFLNPMCQAEASKVAIFSGADYSWNVGGFACMDSWKRAIEELVPEASEAFLRFADNLSFIKEGESFAFDESRYLTDKLEALNSALREGKDVLGAATALKAEFETMREDAALLRNIENSGLLEEISVHLDAYDNLAQAGIASMDGFITACEGDISATMENIRLLQEKLANADTFKVAYMERSGVTNYKTAQVGSKRIKPMLTDSASQIQSLLTKTLVPEVECNVFTDSKILMDKKVSFQGGFYSVSDLDLTLDAGAYVGFNLPKAMKLSEISVTTDQTDTLKLQYSLNGIEWTDAEATAADGVLKTNAPITASYLRAVNTGEEAVSVQIADFRATVVYSIGTPTATTDLGMYGYNYISYAVDGNMRTRFYSSSGTSVGSYVRVDLQKAIPLYDLKICYAPNPKGLQEGVDGFKSTIVEVSTDAVTWTQIGDVIPYTDYVIETLDGQTVASVSYNAEGEMARYIRFSAAESYGNWIQVYEVLYNKAVSNIGDDSVDLVSADFDITNMAALYDGDLGTSATAQNISEGNTLVLPMTSVTNVDSLTIIQDEAQICNAKVSVKDVKSTRDAEDGWREIGALDQQVNTLKVGGSISAVKLTFDGSSSSMNISEILVTEKKDMVREGLKTLYTKWASEDLFGYRSEGADALRAALQTAKDALENKNATRAELNAASVSLVVAVNNLVPGANKTHLATELAIGEKLLVLENNYDPGDVEDLKAALEAGKTVYENVDASQDVVNAAVYAIQDIFERFSKKADVTSLESLIEAAKELAESGKYTDDTTAALQEAIEEAQAILKNPDRPDTALADAYTKIIDAVLSLQQKGNKAALHAMIVKAEEILENSDQYVADTLVGLSEALAAGQDVYEDVNALQPSIDDAVRNLTLEASEVRLLGDVNGDGRINTSDSTALLQAAAEYSALTGDDAAAADVNGDGVTNTSDAALILQYAAEKISKF